MTDFDTQLARVERSLVKGERDGTEVRTVRIRQFYATTAEDLWGACTTATRLERWFLPVSGDLRLGGRYQFEGNAGGTIERCERPEFVAATWEFAEAVSWVELRFRSEGNGAWLELDHIAPLSEFWEQFGPGATGVGWDMGLLGLAIHLETGEPVNREEMMASMMSEEGLDFVRKSAAAWGEASIAGGEDPVWAKEAAERTATFYTTIPEEQQG
jgi:uncharacterized protein YndB with AHSA1/START domain